ncbi:ATPase domain-containing protein [Aidingimonas halophila]|uniref:ATPase domain-containing protein n=1 Tax=Aidingimonas halophila TaxID=574349 RepID=UPI000B8428BF|nr:ATPase domain-containing protein [Aidingimonas halophila]
MTCTHDPRFLTGVAGLDQILHGGLIPRRAYLIRGGPRSGKATLGILNRPEIFRHYLILYLGFERVA